MPDDELADADMLSVPEVHALLEREREARGELSYEQKLAAEHANLLDRIRDEETAKALRKEFEAMDRVSPEQAIKLVDLAPRHPDEVAVVFAKDRQDLSKEDSEAIMSLVREYLD